MEFQELSPDVAPQKAANAAPQPPEEVAVKQSFQPLPYAGEAIRLPDGAYRVYTSPSQFQEVKAGSAYEAMQLSGIKAPYKIMRYELNRLPVLSAEMLASRGPVSAADAPLPATAEESSSEPEIVADEEAALPTEADAVERELTPEEVEALMQAE